MPHKPHPAAVHACLSTLTQMSGYSVPLSASSAAGASGVPYIPAPPVTAPRPKQGAGGRATQRGGRGRTPVRSSTTRAHVPALALGTARDRTTTGAAGQTPATAGHGRLVDAAGIRT